jgi:hypothetical protein
MGKLVGWTHLDLAYVFASGLLSGMAAAMVYFHTFGLKLFDW